MKRQVESYQMSKENLSKFAVFWLNIYVYIYVNRINTYLLL